ncbi:MAG TPA: tetratricopeptide repeat protein [Candidatus Sulfotelmatobacter sp.]|jgi:tetratricopeptide (TPR) repeat protein|nr:tetratricopeptide repeat protein [Candidatus Sulfotelmatobacter sp.]
MAARKLAVAALLAWIAGASAGAQTTSSLSPSAQTNSQTTSGGSSSSTHRKTSAHHTKITEEDGPPPELTKAEAFIQKQDYASAEPLLGKVVSADPSNYEAWFDLGFAENALGKVDDSIAAYRKSVAAKPDVFESNLNLGLQLARKGQPEAEQYLRAATQLKPTSHVAEGQARAWLSLAHVLETTKPGGALAAYRKAAELQPKDPEPHLAAGLLLENQNQFADAEQEYKTVLAFNPSDADALTGLANIYMRGRRFPEAEAELRKLVSAQPEQASARIQLGRVLAAEGKYDEAIAELKAGTNSAPADASLQRDLADLYVLAKKNAEAEAAYRNLLATNPNDAGLHESLGKALLEQKKFADAEKEFLAAIKLKPDLGAAYGDLAFAASENHDYPLTLKALDARVKLLPENPFTYFLRASAYDHLKDLKRAAANYHLFLNTASGKYPEQEWQAKHRLIAIEPKK